MGMPESRINITLTCISHSSKMLKWFPIVLCKIVQTRDCFFIFPLTPTVAQDWTQNRCSGNNHWLANRKTSWVLLSFFNQQQRRAFLGITQSENGLEPQPHLSHQGCSYRIPSLKTPQYWHMQPKTTFILPLPPRRGRMPGPSAAQKSAKLNFWASSGAPLVTVFNIKPAFSDKKKKTVI